MKSSITAGLSPEKKKELENDFNGSVILRERLIALLEGKQEALRQEVRSKTSYESPSWAFLQADYNGYERAISEVISLLSSKK